MLVVSSDHITVKCIPSELLSRVYRKQEWGKVGYGKYPFTDDAFFR